MLIYEPDSNFNPADHFDYVPFSQSIFYKEYLEGLNKKVYRFVGEKGITPHFFIQFSEQSISLLGCFLHAEDGPLWSDGLVYKEKYELQIIDELKEVAKHCFFIRFNTDTFTHFENFSLASDNNFFLSSRFDYLIDLDKSLEKIKQSISDKMSEHINALEKNPKFENFIINKGVFKYFDIFWKFHTKSAARNKIILNKKAHYEHLFILLENNNKLGYLSVSCLNDKPVSILLTFYNKDRAEYVTHAISKEARKLNIGFYTWWEAIKKAKENKCMEYNTISFLNRAEKEGLNKFKLQFNAKYNKKPQAVDLILDTNRHKIYKFLPFSIIFRLLEKKDQLLNRIIG